MKNNTEDKEITSIKATTVSTICKKMSQGYSLYTPNIAQVRIQTVFKYLLK
jgi:hypothetical protein